jgi:hypothetical protein
MQQSSYPSSGVVSTALNELTNTPVPPFGITPLNEMEQFIAKF